MSCARVLVLLEPYVDGELGERRRGRVHAHLQQCAACSRQWQASQRLQVSLRNMPVLEAPELVRQRLQAALPAEPVASTHWQDRLAAAVSRVWDVVHGKDSGVAGWLRPAGAVAALALLVALWVSQRQPEKPAQVAAVSQQELLQAEYEARWALAYLARVTAVASDTAFLQVGDVMGTVIGERVMGSVTDAVGRSLEPRSEPKAPGTVEEEVQTP